MIGNMRKIGLVTVLTALFLAQVTCGGIYLTINGEDVESILLAVEDWCTVEVASDNSVPYMAYLDYSNVQQGVFSFVETRPEAGDFAYAENWGEPYYVYELLAYGISIPPSAGIHFVFRYDAPSQYEEFDLILENESREYIDSVHITVMGSPPPPDIIPPSPDPMTWALPPSSAGRDRITMTATTASDPSGVEYYFKCISGGGHDSGWQLSNTYIDTFLQPSTQYTYQVMARDMSENQNSTDWSVPARATTDTGPDISEALVGYWAMDEGFGSTAFDASGYDNDGSFSTPTIPIWQPAAGRFGGALSFDGAGGGYVVEYGAANYINGLSAFTVALWTKSDLTFTDKGFIIAKDPDGQDNVFTLRYDAIGFSGGGNSVIKAGITSTGGEQQLESSAYVQTTGWQHVALVWSSGNPLQLYINGVPDTPTSNYPATVGTITGATKLIVGKGAKDFTSVWDGLIDDVVIFGHVLGGYEIENIMYEGGASFISDPNLLLLWELDESGGITAFDSSGNGNHGMLTTYRIPMVDSGRIDYALRFDGVGGYVHCGSSRDFDITEAITVAAWVRVSEFTKNWQSILTKGDTSYRLQRYGFSDFLAFHCTRQEGGYIQANGTINVNDNAWHHAAGVYDGSQIYLYTDGILDGNQSASITIGTSHFPVMLGENAEKRGRVWNGFIDDARIYDQALSAAQIEALVGYNTTPPVEPVAHWKLDEWTGVIVHDSAPGGLHPGTICTYAGPIWETGKIDRAVFFNGGGSYVNCGNDPVFDIIDEITVGAWVNIFDVPGDWRGIITKGDSAWRLSTFMSERKFHFAVTSPAMGANWVNGATEVPAGQWHYVCGTYDGENIRLYVDGVEDPNSPVPYTGGITSSSHDVWIGGNSEQPGRGFYGLIDDVAIWNRALYPYEIEWLYNDGFGNPLVSPFEVYVDDDAPFDPGPGNPDISDPLEDGSPEHPFDAIEEAMEVAQAGDIVVVLDGTYVGAGNCGIYFWGRPITVRSQNGPSNCIIDCQGVSSGFSFGEGEDSSSVLDGFTILNAYGGESSGGAISVYSYSSPIIKNCVIRGTVMEYGGGAINCLSAGPAIINCIISDNMSVSGSGGGIYCWNSSPIISQCIIINNTATGSGGGIFSYLQSSPTVVNSTIRNNSPDGIWANSMDYVWIDGTVRIISNNLAGTGTLHILEDAVLEIHDSAVSCDMVGIGTVQVPLGKELVIEDASFIDLASNDPDIRGAIQCEGMLRVKDSAQVSNANIDTVFASFEGSSVIYENVITTRPEIPYGQMVVKDMAGIIGNVFNANGDRYIDVNSSVFAGVIEDNYFSVTITEGRNNTPPALFELRGRDMYCSEPPCEPGLYNLDPLPDFEPNTWTIDRLELLEGAKVTFTNRFDFQTPYSSGGDEEVLYVKNLILGQNSVLNIGLNRLYYDSIEVDPGAVIVEKPALGYLLDEMLFDSDFEFEIDVTTNNVYEPYPMILVERVEGLEPDPTGMMLMRNLVNFDPCSPNYLDVVYALAKGLFAKADEDEILIRFKYLFKTSDPNVRLDVYLSDVPDLIAHEDPRRMEHYIKVAHLLAPPPDRPGSADSGRFGVFQRTVSTEDFDFTEGMWIELELIGPAASYPLRAADTVLALSGGGAEILLDDWGVEVHCDGICLDVNKDTVVTEGDFLTVIAACGLPASLDPNATDSLVCLDGFFSRDGYIDPLDIVSWDWTFDSGDTFLSYCGVPLGESSETIATTAGDFGGSIGTSSVASLPGSLSDLLIAGKRSTSDDFSELKSKDRLYVFDNNGVFEGWATPESERCNIRLIQDLEGNLYQLNSEDGIRRLDDTNEVIVPPGQIPDINEPRYNKSATVYVGIKGAGDEAIGRPILDAAFDANCVYVVPVVVEPVDTNSQPYTAAAKLKLLESGTPPYQLVQLFQDPPLLADNQDPNNLRDIELDDAGNVYISNAYSLNESDRIWKYEPNGTVLKSLSLGNPGGASYIPNPIGLYVSNTMGMLYLASGQYNPADINSTVVYGLSLEDFSLKRSITVNDMQHVSSITEEPASGSLWIVGFNMDSFPLPPWPNPMLAPFYRPRFVEVPYGTSSVQAVSIYDPVTHDLALPISIVWTKPVKCGRADMNGSGDGKVNFLDFAVLTSAWLTEIGDSEWNSNANISVPADAYIDTRDLAVLAAHWLETGCL